MNNKHEILILSMAVHGGLTVYIDIHNAINRDAATSKSILKNLFGIGTPMSIMLEDSESLLQLWDIIFRKVEEFREETYYFLTQDERHYFDILSRYVEALRKTVNALVDRQRLMSEGSKNGSSNIMTWDSFKEVNNSYENAIQEYLAIGQELTDASHIIFGD